MKAKETFHREFFERGIVGLEFIGNCCLYDMGNNLIAKIYPQEDGNQCFQGYHVDIVSKIAGPLTTQYFSFKEHLDLDKRVDERADRNHPHYFQTSTYHVWVDNGKYEWYIAIPSTAAVFDMVSDICRFIRTWSIVAIRR